MTKLRVAINGFGRIGRSFLRLSKERDDMEVVAINDLGDLDNLAYLLKYDTVQGESDLDIQTQKEGDRQVFLINGSEILFLSERDPVRLPWGSLDVDIVVEATGFFASYEGSKAHLDAGAKKVVVSAPVKGEPLENIPGATVLMGINDDELDGCLISSNASCTTNAAGPLLKILTETVGIEKAMLNTVHAYTASQKLVDSPDKGDFRRGRAGAVNIIPSSTGAAKATAKVIKELDGVFDGVAVRVPILSGSLADITFVAKRDTSKEEINEILKEASKQERWKDIFAVTEEPLVSQDIVGSKFASIADLNFTMVVGGNLVKVLCWYDNEMSYTQMLVKHVLRAGQSIAK
jgi:glyceraldehyde 3-phosphate dehydrogenase